MDHRVKLKDLAILLAEDSEINRIIARRVLSDKVKFIDEVSNGKKVVTSLIDLGANYYSLILMDIEMPEMDGYEATKIIRSMEDKDIANIPIIAVSSNNSKEDVQRALDVGMDSFIHKPLTMESFLDALDKVMNHID